MERAYDRLHTPKTDFYKFFRELLNIIIRLKYNFISGSLGMGQGFLKVATSYFVSLRNRRSVPVEAISLPYLGIASPKNGSQ